MAGTGVSRIRERVWPNWLGPSLLEWRPWVRPRGSHFESHHSPVSEVGHPILYQGKDIQASSIWEFITNRHKGLLEEEPQKE